MSIQLKVKAKTLAVEASIIRKEEHKVKKSARWLRDHQHTDEAQTAYATFWNLQDHRKNALRNEARATHLARAFIKAIPYEQVEEKRLDIYEKKFRSNILPRILKMVQKYGDNPFVNEADIKMWAGVL